MRYPPEHKEVVRQRILEVAGRLMRERGVSAVSVQGVMAEAGLTHGGFYNHFASKHDLVEAVFEGGFGAVSERFDANFEELDGVDWLERWIERYLSEGHQNCADRGCPLPPLAGEVARSEEAYRHLLAKLTSSRIDRLAARRVGDQALGRDRAMAMLATVVGALSLARLCGGADARAMRAAGAWAAMEVVRGMGQDASMNSEIDS